MNDADYFSWVATHLHQIQYGISCATISYINKSGDYKSLAFNYLEEGITDIGSIEDCELLRRVIDKIIENEH